MADPPAPDPIAILLAEHRVAEQRFAATDAALTTLADTDATAARRAVAEARATLAFLDADLEVHIRRDEEPLFPRLKAALPAQDRLIDEMVAEHDQARLKRDHLHAALDQILSAHDHADVRERRETLRAAVTVASVTPPGAAEIAAVRRTWRGVRETLRRHFQTEEELVFPLAADLLSAEQLATAGREMIAITQVDHASLAVTADWTAQTFVPNLRESIAELFASPALARNGRTARTLVKDGSLRVALLALRGGGRLADHHASGTVSLHGLMGHVTVTAAGQRHDVTAGALLVLPAGLMHALAAAEDSAVLISIVGSA